MGKRGDTEEKLLSLGGCLLAGPGPGIGMFALSLSLKIGNMKLLCRGHHIGCRHTSVLARGHKELCPYGSSIVPLAMGPGGQRSSLHVNSLAWCPVYRKWAKRCPNSLERSLRICGVPLHFSDLSPSVLFFPEFSFTFCLCPYSFQGLICLRDSSATLPFLWSL